MKRLSFVLMAASTLVGALPSVVTAQSAATAADSDQIPEIIVTAERRAESEQSVPIAVTALTPADLQNLGVSATQDLPLAAPAVTFTTGIGGASVTIRGVSGTGSGSDELASGIYLDGVYLPAPTSAVFFLSDIERVEVLEGPQGTLFGRNSSGGAIQIITHQPGEQTEGQVSVGYGNYGTTTTADYVSGKLVDGLYAGASVYYQNQTEGWGENLFNRSQAYYGNDLSVRGKLRWTPDEQTDITLALMHNEEQNPANQGASEFPGVYTVGPKKTTNVGFYNVDNNIDQNTRNREDNVALTITRDFNDIVRLLSISSSDHVQLYGFLDTGAGPSPSVDLYIHNAPTVTFTQELQLQSEPSSWVKWVIGGFYYNNHVGFSPLYINNVVTVDSRANTDSFAGFGQATIPIITSSTHFTAGLRWTDDIRSFHAIEYVGAHELDFTPEGISNKLLTWHLALDHQFTPTTLAYISDSRGGKSGFYNIASPTAPPTDPQTVLTYEIGVKNELFNRHLQLNAAAFYNYFSDIQVETLLNGLPQYVNAAAAHIKGAELNLIAKPIDHLTFQGGYTYLDGQYTNFPNSEFFTPNPPAKGGETLYFASAAGKDTVSTPHNVFTASVTYDLPTAQGIFSLSPTYYHNSGFWWDPQNSVPQPSYSLFGMVLGWTAPPQSGWYAQVWGKNLNDAHYYAFTQIGTGSDTYNPAPPRTFGLTVGWRFH